jgi:hypothetical protein
MKGKGLRFPDKGKVLTAVAAWNICSHPRTRAPDTARASRCGDEGNAVCMCLHEASSFRGSRKCTVIEIICKREGKADQ